MVRIIDHTKEHDYHVVAILSNTELIINAGKINHINTTDYFDILENKEEQLIDPVNNEVLDTFKRKKQRVYVTEVRKKYCICTSEYIDKSPNHSELFNAIAKGTPMIQETVGRKMKIDKNEVHNILSKYSYSTIHLKDKAILASK